MQQRASIVRSLSFDPGVLLMDEPFGWGWHDIDAWKLFFKTIKDIGQVTTDINAEDVIKNDYVAAANRFDAAKVKADADGYALPDDYKAVDLDAIRKRL